MQKVPYYVSIFVFIFIIGCSSTSNVSHPNLYGKWNSPDIYSVTLSFKPYMVDVQTDLQEFAKNETIKKAKSIIKREFIKIISDDSFQMGKPIERKKVEAYVEKTFGEAINKGRITDLTYKDTGSKTNPILCTLSYHIEMLDLRDRIESAKIK